MKPAFRVAQQGHERRMKQSRRMSLVESLANVAVGFVISLIATAIVLPAFGHAVTFVENVGITTVFTVLSIARSYALRRAFEFIRTR